MKQEIKKNSKEKEREVSLLKQVGKKYQTTTLCAEQITKVYRIS